MPSSIKVYVDYVCPFCFLIQFPLRQAIGGKQIEIEWMPFELRPAPQPTLRPEGEYLRSAWHQSVYPLAELLAVPISLPRVSPQPHTQLAFEGYQAAKQAGLGNPYSEAVMSAFFQQQRDIGQVAVLTEIAGEVGLDPNDFRRALETRAYRTMHQRALSHAYYVTGITSVPTVVIGERWLVGFQTADHLQHVLEEHLTKFANT